MERGNKQSKDFSGMKLKNPKKEKKTNENAPTLHQARLNTWPESSVGMILITTLEQ